MLIRRSDFADRITFLVIAVEHAAATSFVIRAILLERTRLHDGYDEEGQPICKIAPANEHYTILCPMDWEV